MDSYRRHISFLPVLVLALSTGLVQAQNFTFDTDADSGSESVTSVSVGVTATGFGAYPVTVSLGISGASTASQGPDFSIPFLGDASSELMTFNNPGTQTVNINIESEAVYESAETIRLFLGDPDPDTATLLPYPSYEYTINNDDPKPGIKFIATSRSGSEGTTNPANILVVLSTVSGLDASAQYTDLLSGTALPNGVDYTLNSPGTVTVPAGQTQASIPLSVNNDVLAEYGETIDLKIDAPTDATLQSPTALTYTINDNDLDPTVQFVDPTSSNAEGSAPLTRSIQLELSAVSGKEVQVVYTVGGSADDEGVDHNLASGTATIPAGSLTKDIIFSLTDDALDENDETVTLVLSNPTNASLGSIINHTHTIVDDDDTPLIDFSASSGSGSEASSPVSIEVRLSDPAGRDAEVDYAVTGGSASGGGTDYTLASGTATIAAGLTTTTITATITDDALYENNEDFVVTLSSAVNASLGTNQTYTYTITNIPSNDDPPTIYFTSTQSTGGEGTATANLELRLSGLSGLDASVNYAVTGGNALPGQDFILAAGTKTITAGNLTTNIALTVVDDDLYEPSDTVIVTISGPSQASLGGNTSHSRIITDNDSPPKVEFTTGSSSGSEATTPTIFGLALSTESGKDVTVDYSVTAGTATSGGVDFTMAPGTATIPAGQTTTTIQATVVNDDIDEFNETFLISLSNPSNASIGTSFPEYEYTITDNDPTPTIGFSSTAASDDESVNPVSTIIQISAPSGKNIAANYRVTGTATGGGIDFSRPAVPPATIAAGETDTTLNITIIDDDIYERNETIRIALYSPTNVTLSADSVYTYTIENNDNPPKIQFNLASSGGSEGITPASIQIDLTGNTAVNASVDYAVTGGTATGGGTDYTLASGTATINAGAPSTTIPAVIVDDLYDEPNETFIVTLTNPVDATLDLVQTHTRTITDDDDPPTVAFTTLGSSGNESTVAVTLPVKLSAASQLTITVDYTITEVTALRNGVDFSLADGQLTFSAGSDSANINAVIVDDQIVEQDESFQVTLSNPVNASLGGALTTFTYNILNDDDPPADFAVDTVYATGGTPVAGFWNASNTALSVTVPVDTASNLVNGEIRLEAKVSSSDYGNFGAAYSIVSGDLGSNKIFSRSAGTVETLPHFGNDSTITVRAVITDVNGNSTTGTPSSSTILIDQAPPAAFTTGSVTTTGGTVVSGYWNDTNTAVRIVVPVDTDTSLVGGSIQLSGKTDGSFENLGVPTSISFTNLAAGSKTLTVNATEAAATGVEELAGYADEGVLSFGSVITDAAGNSTTGTASSTTLNVDVTSPTAVVTYTDTLASQGDTVTITLTADEALTATPKISIAYSFNTIPAANMTLVDPTIWTYDALIPPDTLNDGLATVTVTVAKDLAGNALTTANTTGRTRLLVDNTPPGYVLSYSDSLVKVEEVVTITATVAEPVQLTPTVSIDFAGTGSDVTGATMSMGASDSIWTYQVTTPSGNDGFAIVAMTAFDIAGNAVVPISGSTNTLKVDNTAPILAASSPVEDAFMRTTAVSYTLGEAIASGQVVWIWEENPGVTDDNSPHVQTLAAAERSAGTHTGLLTSPPTLVQAAAYTIQFVAADRAGNADTVSVTGVTYDTLAPGIQSVVVIDGPGSDIDITQSTDTLTAHFSGFSEPTSGIVLYEYALGSSNGASNIVDWTSNATDTLVIIDGLSLLYKSVYYVGVRAMDGAGNLSDSVYSDGVRIVDKPRLTLNVVQNSVFTDYIQLLVSDTLGMADSIRVLVDSVRVSVTEIDTFTYAGTHRMEGVGPHSLEVRGFSVVGDTLRTASLSMALAKSDQSWVAASVDRLFVARGMPGAVTEDRYLIVVDSTLLGTGLDLAGAYRLGDGQMEFGHPVKVSMEPGGYGRGEQHESRAIYGLDPDGRWEELPTIDDGTKVTTWANRSGTFRLGPRTIIVPFTTELHQNYPNPFNPSTRIVFDLGFVDGPSQKTTIAVYNLLGQQVTQLFNGNVSAGRHELLWHGIDDQGSLVASGIYFVRLSTSSGYHKTRKMLLIR